MTCDSVIYSGETGFKRLFYFDYFQEEKDEKKKIREKRAKKIIKAAIIAYEQKPQR
jgi:hypothetical protein